MDKSSPSSSSIRLSKYSLDAKSTLYKQYASRGKASSANTIPIPTHSELLALQKELQSLAKKTTSKAAQLEIDIQQLSSISEIKVASKTVPSTPKILEKKEKQKKIEIETPIKKEKPEIKVTIEDLEDFHEPLTPQARPRKSVPSPVATETKLKRRRRTGTHEPADVSDTDKDSPMAATPTPRKTRSSDTPSSKSKPKRSASPYISGRESASRNSTPRPSKKSGKNSSHLLKKKKNSDTPEEAKKSARGSLGKDVEEDYPTAKIANQIPIQTYWNYIESFFRPITEEDIAFLEERGDETEPYIVPPLGRNYLEAWAEEERKLVPQFDDIPQTPTKYDHMDVVRRDDSSEFSVEDLACGPLTERIICALIQENLINPQEYLNDEDSDSNTEDIPQNEIYSSELADMEERLKRELRYIGILGDEDIDWNAREDDEISSNLRNLQKELRDQVKVNNLRKEKLLGISTEHLACQEYLQILEELDKQIEQSYIKRVVSRGLLLLP
ncbi:Transcriptional regulator, variant 2 [Basidiobolus ranarum]|uniref:Transcriptional regulator, variant 2 n=1 Tax=Basidiobolus ranarum TaxID=34480 RepID=A0ABR2W0X8_9FUNG